MSSATLGLSPDPKNPLNDVSTMNKTMEYMAFGLPVVAFDLLETRESAGSAAMYVDPNDVERYAEAIADLVDDPDRRQEMAHAGRARVVDVLAWEHQDRAMSQCTSACWARSEVRHVRHRWSLPMAGHRRRSRSGWRAELRTEDPMERANGSTRPRSGG